MKKYLKIKNLPVYEIEEVENITSLIYGPEEWTKPGKVSCTLEDTGEGFIFKDVFMKKTFKLDYAQAVDLVMLLKLGDHIPKAQTYSKVKDL